MADNYKLSLYVTNLMYTDSAFKYEDVFNENEPKQNNSTANKYVRQISWFLLMQIQVTMYMQCVSEIQGTTLGACSMHTAGGRRLRKHRSLDASS